MRASKLLEPEIKALVLNHLMSKGHISTGSTVISEFTIDRYSRRVDLATVRDNCLTAFEIKSEADSLSRLVGQIEKYLHFFDKVVIVAAPKHIENILISTPASVEVWEVSQKSISLKRRGKIARIRERSSLIELMKANELLKLSGVLGLDTRETNRQALAEKLSDVSPSTLRKNAHQFIKNRYLPSSTNFWTVVGERPIEAQHIEFLSPYKGQREISRVQEENRVRFWDNLLTKSDNKHMLGLAKENDEPAFGDVPSNLKSLI
jgi:hypothetical protein